MSFTATGAKDAKEEDRLSKIILDAAFRVHSVVGPGLLENAYEACLAYELRNDGLQVLTQLPYRSCIGKSGSTLGTGLIYWSRILL
jgi:GxxExxY protein